MKVGTYSERWGNYVRRQRCLRRLTARELAQKVKLDQSYISLMQRGYVPSLGVVDRLATALNLNTDEVRLMAGFGPRNPTRILKLVQKLKLEDTLTEGLRQEFSLCAKLPPEDQDQIARMLMVYRLADFRAAVRETEFQEATNAQSI